MTELFPAGAVSSDQQLRLRAAATDVQVAPRWTTQVTAA